MSECAVRHLHVAAATEAAARRFVTTLEDALRCATLPGGDRRVVAVRRLALGRVPHDAGTQGLGQLIEERLAHVAIDWASGDDPPDPRADVVGFAAALEARVQLARRLATGAPCDAWYWPQVVPEYRRDLAPREALRRIAQALVALPEARVALPAWLAGVVGGGGAGALLEAIDDTQGLALLRAAGIALPAVTPQAAPSHAAVVDASPVAHRAATAPPAATATHAGDARRTAPPAGPAGWPRWLRVALARAGAAHDAASNESPPAPRAPAASADARAKRDPTTAALAITNESLAPLGPASAPPDATDARPATFTGASAPPVSDIAPHAAHTPIKATRDVDWRATDCGGVLFLLPVLARCGLVAPDDPDAARRDALHVLALALNRVRAQPHDPAWALVAELGPLPPAAARDAQARARHALATARVWLQRHARVGLVTLVRRRAALALTATHIDVRFPLAGADVRLRRLGLDTDPGWLPWFGRVIAFQFAGRLP